LRQISHQILEEFLQLFFTLLERRQIGKRKFPRCLATCADDPVRLAGHRCRDRDRKDQHRICRKDRQAPGARSAATRRMFLRRVLPVSLGLLADSPDFANRQILHEPGHFFWFTSNWPFGLFISLAILAISLLGPIPADEVSFVSRKIVPRITCASGPSAPRWALTSR